VEFKPEKNGGKVHVENAVQKNEIFDVVFPVLFLAFLDVSLHGKFKNTNKLFLEKSPKTSKKAPTHLRGRSPPPFFFSSSAP
jgi:hypothetical protein